MINMQEGNISIMMLSISIIGLIFGSLRLNLISILTNSTIVVLQLGSLLHKQKNNRIHYIFDQCLLLYYCCSQLATRGVFSLWFILFSLGNEIQLTQFIIIPIIIGFTLAQVEPIQSISIIQLLIEQLILLSYLLYTRMNSSNYEAQNVLIKQIISNTIFKVVDNKSTESDEIDCRGQYEMTHATVFSARNDKIKFQLEPFEEIKIKCYPTQQEYNEQQSSLQKPAVFRNIKDFVQVYQKDKKEMEGKLIIVKQLDRTGQKQYYRLFAENFRQCFKQATIIAFVKFDQNVPFQKKIIDKFKNCLSKIFTHKLKTPLNTTLGFLQAAVMENTKIDEHVKHNFLKPAFINSKIQYYSIQDMLDYVNQAELISYNVTKVNLHKILQLIFDLIELQCRAKKIRVQFQINSVSFDINEKYDTQQIRPIYLLTDQLRLERILFNLLNKSYRHTEMGGQIVLNVEIQNESNKVYFTIKDNVVGFKQDQIEYINSQAYLQNISTGTFRNSILKRNKFKFSLTLQITNKLIYILSDSQCSLSIRNNNKDGADYHFFISLASSRTVDPSIELMQNKSQQVHSVRSLKQHIPNHVLLLANNTTLLSGDQIVEGLEINNEPQPKRPLQLSTQMPQYSPKSTVLRSTLIQNSILPLCKSVYQKEINDKSVSISMDHAFNSKRVADSIDIRQDVNQTIMLVDDEPFNHDTLKIMLRGIGFKNFVSAYNGQECLELVEKHHKTIKMIFMDLEMPIMNGLKTTMILINMMENNEIECIPIIACTAHDDRETQSECIQAGMLCVIAKPVFLRTLQESFVKVNEFKTKSQNLLFASKVISSSIK